MHFSMRNLLRHSKQRGRRVNGLAVARVGFLSECPLIGSGLAAYRRFNMAT